ncbi:flavin reductase family protein [Thalassotalea ponticola]|uniref:flavin reductase family protein n=1 Tax=Thalassotalea ponticola TaxID=1523392 RepID=UPI0025B4CB6B|nr:flavin reductase family protein [Thalassotalea ponticola]MDN3653809.1 flavin reductase family protein [Thalassotalea ponticola]
MTVSNFDSREFRNVLGNFATGVTIITTRAEDGQPVGLTANSFNSVSLDPPLVLWSLAKTAASVPVFEQAEHWNVHILSVEQEPLSNLFASKGADKFANVELEDGITPAPLIADCTTRLQCRNAFQYDGGDHIIFVGEVLDFDAQPKAPLAFVSGQYALTARKPYEGVNLSSSEALSASYNEDLLGYLLGRAHFQMLHGLKTNLGQQQLSELEFYILSILGIQKRTDIDRLNAYLAHNNTSVTLADFAHLEQLGMVAVDQHQTIELTDIGKATSLAQIKTAKGLEQAITDALGEGEVQALKLLLKKVIKATDPGIPDLWQVQETAN